MRGLGIGLALLVMVPAADARFTREMCLTVSEFIKKVAIARDGGVPIEKARAAVRIADAPKPIRDLGENLVRLIYMNDDMSGTTMSRDFYLKCVED
jgi:hypothetical protein